MAKIIVHVLNDQFCSTSEDNKVQLLKGAIKSFQENIPVHFKGREFRNAKDLASFILEVCPDAKAEVDSELLD